jgi:hypothetical protein
MIRQNSPPVRGGVEAAEVAEMAAEGAVDEDDVFGKYQGHGFADVFEPQRLEPFINPVIIAE